MRIFTCPSCGASAYFHNLTCPCGAALAFDPEQRVFVEADDPCVNRDAIDCNWIAERAGACRACAMTEVIPDTGTERNRALWADAEAAKRWVVANLGRWGWFTDGDSGPVPVFHLLAEETASGPAQVTMGHDSGLVTINVTESDPATREKRREELAERLRTMVAHFRHEIAHFLFERLKERDGFLEAFRARFGDERADYAAALERHYGSGPPDGWHEAHVTPYAASHPHEDWAETAAHLQHLTDIVDSALAAGLRSDALTNPAYDAYAETETSALVDRGVDFGIAMNHVNRAMGLPDAYPFVLNRTIRDKLAFAHDWLRGP